MATRTSVLTRTTAQSSANSEDKDFFVNILIFKLEKQIHFVGCNWSLKNISSPVLTGLNVNNHKVLRPCEPTPYMANSDEPGLTKTRALIGQKYDKSSDWSKIWQELWLVKSMTRALIGQKSDILACSKSKCTCENVLLLAFWTSSRVIWKWQYAVFFQETCENVLQI